MSRTLPRAEGARPGKFVSRSTFIAGANDTDTAPERRERDFSAARREVKENNRGFFWKISNATNVRDAMLQVRIAQRETLCLCAQSNRCGTRRRSLQRPASQSARETLRLPNAHSRFWRHPVPAW